ncbi:MAG: hydantoinase/oxoprolinase family protein [Thermodesulfobacteriota bacterium]
MSETRYAIGIDTGGTYTDGVLLNLDDLSVVATAKSPTTHFALSNGIALCLRDIFVASKVKPNEVELVAVSTTLATNAVVEQKGDRVGLIVAGYNKPFTLPVVTTLFVEGGHTITGDEAKPLDMDSLVRAVSQLQGNVDAYAVCSAMSIKNPAHEMVMAKAISMMDPLPTFMSHEVSNRAGMQERAATAVLNARLRPVMDDFLRGMQETLVMLGLASNVKIIRGDAKAMDIADTARQAAATVASGPAATAWFGLSFAPAPNCIIVDVGGTTTDITMIKDGQPTLSEDGSHIGAWQTHVDSVRMSTVGAGGDSQAKVSAEGTLSVGPARVLPLAMAQELPAPGEWLGPGLRTSMLTIAGDLSGEQAANDPVLAYLFESGPATPEQLLAHFEMSEITLVNHLHDLVKGDMAWETGFTPTDALHVVGELELGNIEAARQGAEILGAAMGLSGEEFARQVLVQVSKKIEDGILDHILAMETGKTLSGFYPEFRHSQVLDIRLGLKLPLVGIGAAARLLLPPVAKKLATSVTFPDHFEVGNALGGVLMAAGEGPR